MKQCVACGMPLEKPEDCAGGNLDAISCIYCTGDDGNVLPCEEIFEGGVGFFMDTAKVNREEAEKHYKKSSVIQTLKPPCVMLTYHPITKQRLSLS